MLTILLAIAHASSANENFRPELLYLGTLYVDVVLIKALTAIYM